MEANLLMIRRFIEGCIPKTVSAEALVSNLSLNFHYRVDGIETGSPLKRISHKSLVIKCDLPKGWFLDLDAVELENLDLIRSHGRGIFQSKSWDSTLRKNAVTHYYLHPHDCTCIIVHRTLHRLPERFEETLKFSGPIRSFEIQDRLLKLHDQEMCIIFNREVDVNVNEDEVEFSAEGKSYGYAICLGESAKEIRRATSIQVSLEPDITQPGTYLMKDEEAEIKLKIRGPPEDLESAEISLYGLTSLKRRLPYEGGECQLIIKFTPKRSGIVPLLALIRGKDFLQFFIFDILVLPVAISSPDHRFNGVFVEVIRSMLQRRVFNVIPEEDPRGEMIYHHGFWPRNLYAYGLFCFGFQGLGVKMVKTYGYLMEKYRFLFDSYSLYGQEVFSNPLVSISNDGVGFYLFQTGKILLRRPDLLDEDFKRGIKKAVTWLNYATHWNGLIFDKTEAVDHCRSERLVGNPYTQSICMAGLKIISEALEECGEKELSREAREVYERQLRGFMELYGGIGYFRDLTYKNPDKPGLSTYSMPAPGCFLLDPELEESSLRGLVSETMRIIMSKCVEPGNRWAITGGTGRIGLSYAQLGTAAALLNIGAIDDAWKVLNEILEYAESTGLKYILPEVVVLKTHEEEYRRAREEHRRIAPWLYNDKTEGLPGWPCNPGNLIHMSYYLFVADLICGIFHRQDGIIIKPRIPSEWKTFMVKNYPTRYGPVSYEYKRSRDKMRLIMKKPHVSADVIIELRGQIGKAIMNNKEARFKIIKENERKYVELYIPKEIEAAEISLNQADKP